jgi:hypothetical protein
MAALTALPLSRYLPRRVRRHERPRCLAAERSLKVEALDHITPHGHQARHLPVVLHSFSGHRKPQRARKVLDQAHDSIVHRVFTQR